MNKYKQNAEREIDLHGYTTNETEIILNSLVIGNKYRHVQIIVDKGNNSTNGPVLPNFVRNYLNTRNIHYNQSKLEDGGEGAIEVFF